MGTGVIDLGTGIPISTIDMGMGVPISTWI